MATGRCAYCVEDKVLLFALGGSSTMRLDGAELKGSICGDCYQAKAFLPPAEPTGTR